MSGIGPSPFLVCRLPIKTLLEFQVFGDTFLIRKEWKDVN